MRDLFLIEEAYKKFVKDLTFWVPEGIYSVNLELLYQLDLLHFQPLQERQNSVQTGYFHIIESAEKITMINDEFVIWIIPEKHDQISVTYTLIALHTPDQEPHLEAAFVASGVYNTSELILKILEKFLIEIQETEKILSKFHS